jgi:preprotein translocase YajC subunit
MEQLTQFATVLLMFVVIYFFMIRPQQKRAKKRKKHLKELNRKIDVRSFTINCIKSKNKEPLVS